MGKKKHQFIDKKTAHKFTLVHRSQRDPLQADEGSSQHVLKPVDNDSAAASSAAASLQDDESYEYGIYYEDDYDYMQHLRPRGEGMLVCADDPGPSDVTTDSIIKTKTSEKVSIGNLLLPSEALPSKDEEDVGMLNKGILPRGPQPDWDPDIVAALDDALDLDDPDNLLEDDFIMVANSGEKLSDKHSTERDDENADGEWGTASEHSDDDEYIDSDHLLSDEEMEEEETKSRFTSYSMTSSIIRRTQGLKLLDDQFERIMEQYDEDEIGCVSHEEVTGNMGVNNELVSQLVDEFINDQKLHGLSEVKDDDDIDKTFEESGNSEEESDEKLFSQFDEKPKEKWDCESIISTYSNIYNHPKLIIEKGKRKTFELDKHTGIPVGVLKDDEKQVDSDNEDETTIEVVLNNVRNKNESAEERRKRKNEVKEHRKNRRAEKKDNKLAFKTEYKKQEQIAKHTESQKGIKM